MQSFNPFELWQNMGFLARLVVLFLVGMSIYSLWVMIDRYSVFSKAKRYSLVFVQALKEHLAKHDLNGAMKLSLAEPKSPLSRVVQQALIEYRDGLDAIATHGADEIGEFDVVDAVNRAIDWVKEREVAGLKKGLGRAGLDLLGGALHRSVRHGGRHHQRVSLDGAERAGRAGRGLRRDSQALFTTAVGLVVAIPAVMAFNYFNTAIEELVVDMNDISSELVSYMLREGRSKK